MSAPTGSKPSAPSTAAKSGSTPPATPKGGASPTDYSKSSSADLQKTIAAQTKQIDTTRARVNNPRANYPGWGSLSQEQQSALLRQWNADIKRQEASRATAQKALSQKSR